MDGPAGAGKSRRARRLQTFGRVAVWAIPIFAVFVGLFPRSSAAFSNNPTAYAHYLATGRTSTGELIRTIGVGTFGVLSIVGLAALLIRARGRWFAMAGAVLALAGSAVLLLEVGSVVIRNERMRDDLFAGRFDQFAANAQITSSSAALRVAIGVGLLTLGWILLGIAVFRGRGLNRADGVLLVISAPMIYIGGMVLPMIPTLGSFLLLAAGLGLGFAAGRVEPANRRLVMPPRFNHQHSALARFVDTEDYPDVTSAAAGRIAPDFASAAAAYPQGEYVPPDGHDPGAAGLDRAGKPWGLRGVPTSWSVTRPKTDDPVAPPPATPSSARNRKPIATTKKNRSVRNGASVNTIGLGDKSAGGPERSDGAAASGPQQVDVRDQARRDKARNRGKQADGKPDRSKGSSSGQE